MLLYQRLVNCVLGARIDNGKVLIPDVGMLLVPSSSSCLYHEGAELTGVRGLRAEIPIDRGDEKQRKFQSALKQIGFTVKLKPYIQRRDGTSKGDWDVGIAIDVMEAAREVDTVVLLSGDGDFDLLLKKIRDDYSVRAEVYGVPALTANALIDAASLYHRIDEGLLF